MARSSNDYYYERPRSRSRTGQFLDEMDRGHFRSAVDVLRPGGGGGGGGGGGSSSKSREAQADLTPSPRGRRNHYQQHRRYSDDGMTRGAGDGYSTYETDRYLDSGDHGPRRRQHITHRREHHSSASSGGRGRRDPYYYDDSRGRDPGGSGPRRSRPRRHSSSVGVGGRGSGSGPDLAQATKAAIAAGVIEGFRARRDPDGAMRAVTAAAGATAVDALIGQRGDRKDKRHIVESAIGGLALNRLANGPRRR